MLINFYLSPSPSQERSSVVRLGSSVGFAEWVVLTKASPGEKQKEKGCESQECAHEVLNNLKDTGEADGRQAGGTQQLHLLILKKEVCTSHP